MLINQSVNNANHTTLRGLTDSEVAALREEYGRNQLPEEKPASKWTLLLNQIKSPLVYIILVAALVSLWAREYGDFGIIMAVIVFDVILGYIQELKAQNTYTALKNLLKPTTTVLRNGDRCEVEVWELVPGDLVILNNGEKVPGDGRILEGNRLSADEAILTGESEPVSKAVDDRVFMGTTILTGHGAMQVEQTGLKTELGQIASSLQDHVEEETPLQVRLKQFSGSLTRIVAALTLAILIAGLAMGNGFLDMVRTSIILAIAAVPEGLLIAVTVILVLGMRKILKREGLVRRLSAVETLGSVTTICTDKTGTLTEGRMKVSKKEFIDPERAVQAMVLCNDMEGPVEIALWEHARETLGDDPQTLVDSTQRLDEELFTSETKFMITAIGGEPLQGQTYHFLKGAPEIVIRMCALLPNDRTRLLNLIDQWAGQGLRVLALAYRAGGMISDHSNYTLAGLVGMEDPVREGVDDAIRLSRRAGIHVKMITGDYRKTAEFIASKIGLMQPGDESLEGSELTDMSDDTLTKMVRQISVFSRIRPQDKFRVIKALQSSSEITAMIGDGVNDAPALQRANIGVVVGTATDVAKENADLILMDNNFKTIVAAIEEGRIIFQNIQKVVAYTLSNSFAEVLAIFLAMILGWPTPLVVSQILWIHLICDGPSDIVLGFEPKEDRIMDEKPKPLSEPILNRLGLSLIGVISISSALVALFLFNHLYQVHGDINEARSIVFASFGLNSMVYIFAYRSLRRSIFKTAPLSSNLPLVWSVMGGIGMVILPFLIPGLGKILSIAPLHPDDWLIVVGFAFLLLIVVEISKWAFNRRQSVH
jgi:Ca2+-transporting ATPase